MRCSLLLSVALLVCASCKSSDGGGNSPGASGGSGANGTPSAASPAGSTGALGPLGASVPGVGSPCRPGPDSIACAPGGSPQELTCASGVWRALQSCRGPGGCQGAGSALHCDLGTPLVGDACLLSTPARCAAGKPVLQACQSGKWTETACPTACVVPDGGSGPTCK